MAVGEVCFPVEVLLFFRCVRLMDRERRHSTGSSPPPFLRGRDTAPLQGHAGKLQGPSGDGEGRGLYCGCHGEGQARQSPGG